MEFQALTAMAGVHFLVGELTSSPKMPHTSREENQRQLMAFRALQDPCSAAHCLWVFSPPRLPLPRLFRDTSLFVPGTLLPLGSTLSFLCQNSLPPDPACLTSSPPSGLYLSVTSQPSLPWPPLKLQTVGEVSLPFPAEFF